jgi:splicing factor 3A subunit 3
MSTSRIEQTRLLHQDVEQQQRKMVEVLLEPTKTDKENLLQDHKVKMHLDQLVGAGRKLLEAYADPDGVRQAELDRISGENQFSVYYNQLKDIREYHRNHAPVTLEKDKSHTKPKVKFGGQEAYGKFLDLNQTFELYNNLPMVKGDDRLDYKKYLNQFSTFDHIQKERKLGTADFKAYSKYLAELWAYLAGFFARVQPLVPLESLLKVMDAEFKTLWANKNVVGWFEGAVRVGDEVEEGADKAAGEEQKSADQGATGALVAKCPAVVKASAKEDNPLYCRACDKAFGKHTTFEVHLKGRKHKKNAARLGTAATGTESKMEVEKKKRGLQLAQIEFRIWALTDLLADKVAASKDFFDKKQTRTLDEITADLEEQVAEDVTDSESEDEDRPIYNPLNLPLGWDDKPIPYWLYKLHGLNLKFDCEICGGYAYWGPRAFERHFTEWRHTYGMRCLGIQMTQHYMNVTKFEDAIALSDKINKSNAISGWRPEEEEEFEDDQGNVFNKKTYDDLKRQGII